MQTHKEQIFPARQATATLKPNLYSGSFILAHLNGVPMMEFKISANNGYMKFYSWRGYTFCVPPTGKNPPFYVERSWEEIGTYRTRTAYRLMPAYPQKAAELLA